MALKLLKKKFSKLLNKIWPILLISFFVAVFFYPVFLKKQFPIPGDFVAGTYFPWMDYKWGFPVRVPVKNPVTSDVVSIIYPLRTYAVDFLKSGHLPLWNPLMFTGTPLFADFQVALFSPTIFLYFLLPKIWAWTGQIILQPFLAAFFCYFLLRNFKLGKIASVFGGIFYAFSSFNIIWMEWNTNTLTAAFIPLVFLFLDKFISSSKAHWGILLSVSICMQILSGYPQLVIFTLLFAVIYVLFKIKQFNLKKLILLFVFIILGIGLSSVFSVPASELVLNSQRKFELLSRDLVYLPWKNLVTILAPDYFGNSATYNYFSDGNYTINTIYSGIVVLTLAIIGVSKCFGRKEVKYFTSVFFISIIFALPTVFGKILFNSHIPGISASSNTRILVFANFALAILAGFGITKILEKKKIKLKRMFVAAIPLILLIFIFIFTYFWGINKNVSIRNLILPFGLSGLTVAALIFREKIYSYSFLKKIIVVSVCALAVFELFRYGWKYTPYSTADLIFPNTPILEYLQKDKSVHRVSLGNTVPMNMLVPYGMETVSGYDASYPIWWARFLYAIKGQDPNEPGFSYYAEFDSYFSDWFDILNNKYLLVLDPEQTHDITNSNLIYQVEKDPRFEKVFQDKSVIVYENKEVFPRAFFMSDWEYVPESDTLKVLKDPKFPLKNKITIDKYIDLEKSKNTKAIISYKEYSPERNVIEVSSTGNGFLVVTDSWYPGWKVKVDGIDSQIYRADYIFKSVPIGNGNHVIEFYYEPPSLKIGKVITLASGFILLLVILLHRTVERLIIVRKRD